MTPPPSPGLYDEFLTPDEIRDHEAIPRNDLSSEIWLLRAMAGRYLGWLKAASPSGEIEVNDSMLRGLARVMGEIASVLNAHMKLNPPLSAIANDIEEGLNMAREKLGILNRSEMLASGFPAPLEAHVGHKPARSPRNPPRAPPL